MNSRFPHLNVPDVVFSEEITKTLHKMNSLCDVIAQDPSTKRNLDELHSSYWQFLTLYLPTLLTEETKNDFNIPKDFLNIVNYGYVSPVLCSQGDEVLTQLQKLIDVADVSYDIFYMADWIKDAYERSIRLDERRRIEQELAAAEADIAIFPQKIEECNNRRHQFIGKYPKAKRVMDISEEIDKRLPIYLDLKRKIELSQRITAQERIQYVQLTEEITSFREARAIEQQAISNSVPQHELMRLDREVEGIMVSKREGEIRLDEARLALAEDTEFRKTLSVAMCRSKIKEEIRRLRTMGDLISRRSRVKECAILTDVSHVPAPQTVAECIEEIMEIDQTIFLMDSNQRKKFPVLIILPSFGDGAYDVERHAFFVPIRSLKGLQQSLATALIEFHLDSASATRFRDSYLRLKKNQNINSSIQLRDSIVKDYIGWVTLEAKGYQVLDQEARTWFVEQVAPPMFALKHPRTLSMETRPVGEVHALLEEYEAQEDKNEDDFERMFRLGIGYWRVRQYIKSNYMFMRATFLDPRSKDACYNAALSCFKTD